MTAIGGHFQMHGFRIRFTSTLLTKSTFTHDASLLNWDCDTSSKAQVEKLYVLITGLVNLLAD